MLYIIADLSCLLAQTVTPPELGGATGSLQLCSISYLFSLLTCSLPVLDYCQWLCFQTMCFSPATTYLTLLLQFLWLLQPALSSCCTGPPSSSCGSSSTFLEESVDVKALRARFSSKARTSHTSSRDSNSPRSPQSRTEKGLLFPSFSPPGHPHMAGVDVVRSQTEETTAASTLSKPVFFPQSPPIPGVSTSVQSSGVGKVKQTGELLQKMMLRSAVGTKVPCPAPTSTPLQLRQRSTGSAIPLRRPLPPEGPLPLKPKRPPNINLEHFQNVTRRGWPFPASRTKDGSPGLGARRMSSPGATTSSHPLPQSIKPRRLQNQVPAMDIDSNQDTYDDIANLEEKESWSNSSSQWMEGDESDVYEDIDENQVRVNWDADKKKETREKRHQAVMKRLQRENELRKKFQLQEEEEILHTARVRYDWNGEGKLDLKVHQGQTVEIVRVKNNPEGKWLARSLDGKYGYISNTCVDVDYEAVRRKLIQSRKIEAPTLPPPPPDPPQMLHMDTRNSLGHGQDDYDGFHLPAEDFPPPPPEISIDPKVEKELRKKFKYKGPLRVIDTLMVDPNAVMKKPGGKDLHVTQGDVLDVIQLTDSKKALCHNSTSGKYGYVSRNLLLPLDGDIYDDIEYSSDLHDNDFLHADY
ncbi:FYN-binding protein 1 isoform X2 [Dunckerocampus dactyliophorus]|uniref:FYN-binding protein 1 isoform X2 n=1 Tax=Dunckerocampus dactyliophorus TaxID=161453 RepID=UPI002405FE01|nr:FYN-binding protein 1 isoform X2 [Dunckerocampus dactyliophorus]